MPFNQDSLKNLRQYRDRKPEKDRAQSAPAESVALTNGQALTLPAGVGAPEILEKAAPAAALLVAKLITGALRAPPHVRLQAALATLESQGLMGKQPATAVGDAEGALLERIGEALQLRQRKATAVDVEPEPQS